MKRISTVWKLATLLIVVAILSACSTPNPGPSIEPTIDSRPTFSAIQTEAAQTVVANMTSSAPSATPAVITSTATEVPPTETTAPTDTPAVTNTPLPPTATPSRTPVPWTATPYTTPTSSTYNCTVTDFSPKSSNKLTAGVDFDGRWTVTNTGSKSWLASEVDFRYIGGTKFQTKGDTFDLKADVASGSSYTVIVDMIAPKEPGWYAATWAIVRGSQNICNLNLYFQVVQ